MSNLSVAVHLSKANGANSGYTTMIGWYNSSTGATGYNMTSSDTGWTDLAISSSELGSYVAGSTRAFTASRACLFINLKTNPTTPISMSSGDTQTIGTVGNFVVIGSV